MICTKVRYPDKKQAVTAKNFHERKRHMRFAGAKQLRVYTCPHCQGWHLSKVRADSDFPQ
jgi:hypothetical protein